ncbi:MAG: glutamine--fructose-6-phosphate transaminase (isomerizing) [Clostridia bacterium]|nr:glutamine--fructose-6-phosphate transaminase (isomerizing) [Clostridia bacterium]
MCGIIGYIGKNKAVPYLIRGLEHLEYRGYDSSGIAVSQGGEVITVKASGRISDLKSKLAGIELTAKCGIGHTRWATHGEPDDINSHPHSSMSGLFTVVHNGIIENYLPLKKELLGQGFTFKSSTDTEVIANLLEKYYEGDVLSALSKCRRVLEGSYALCIICRDFPDTLYGVRKGSPLHCALKRTESFFASDTVALLPYTREIFTLGEGETAVMKKGKITFYGSDGAETEKKAERVNLPEQTADKGDFPHFMLKEIYEQPQVLRKTLSALVRDGELLPELSELKKSFFALQKICFVGCGSAYHAGLAGKILMEGIGNITCVAETASEFRYGNTPLDGKTLCIFISQSGETADTLAALMKAKEKKAKTLSVINVRGSTMAGESDNVIYTEAGTEIAVATTKAYTAQLMALYLFALCFAHERWQIKRSERDRLLSQLSQLPEKVQSIIDRRDRAELFSSLFDGRQEGWFIGRGSDYASAMEGSLKMKEISYINTGAYPAGELKHGTISLLERGTPVVALCCEERLFPKTFANIKEVKARGARVLILAQKKSSQALTDEENVFLLPDTEDEFAGLLQAVALQLISYFTALKRGCDIDKPKNLAKSVTVE